MADPVAKISAESGAIGVAGAGLNATSNSDIFDASVGAFRQAIVEGKWPQIEWSEHLLPQVVDLAEAAMLSHPGDPSLYQRGGLPVRVVRRPAITARGVSRSDGALGIVTVDVAHIRESFTQRADWVRFDKREQGFRKIVCPEIVARTYLSRGGNWHLPPLVATIEAPTIRPDGSILQAPGYDAATGLLFNSGNQDFPVIPHEPSAHQIKAALNAFAEMLSDFPFEEAHDYSVALSAILTALVRCRLRSAPLIASTAPVMASGKTLIMSLPSWIATGRAPAVVQHSQDPSEEQKLLLSVLMDGDPVVLIDNVERPINSDALCSILTAETFRGRPLGKTGTVSVPTCVLFLATGNNLVIAGDLTTRTLLVRLDPKTEHPERRSFTTDIHEHVVAHRAELVAAALTIMRGFLSSGVSPADLVAPWGRFEEWSNLVRAAIVWAGLPDPCKSLDRLELEDPARLEHSAVLTAWYKVFNGDAAKVDQVIECCDLQNEELKVAVMAIASDHGSINGRRFGRWLARHENRIHDGLSFRRAGIKSGQVLWKVIADPTREAPF
ncbi:MAG: hypothetical protein HY067_09605 [Betaproteobacteria bacterium]|nr:hypothetical protein [Betaproteobacteria bacterium]